MKKLNRKKIIEQLEISRQGFYSARLYALKHKDDFAALSFSAHYEMLDRFIVELGGETIV